MIESTPKEEHSWLDKPITGALGPKGAALSLAVQVGDTISATVVTVGVTHDVTAHKYLIVSTAAAGYSTLCHFVVRNSSYFCLVTHNYQKSGGRRIWART
jgi:hypothetical protein